MMVVMKKGSFSMRIVSYFMHWCSKGVKTAAAAAIRYRCSANNSVALVPPKPKEFLTMTLRLRRRRSLWP